MKKSAITQHRIQEVAAPAGECDECLVVWLCQLPWRILRSW